MTSPTSVSTNARWPFPDGIYFAIPKSRIFYQTVAANHYVFRFNVAVNDSRAVRRERAPAICRARSTASLTSNSCWPKRLRSVIPSTNSVAIKLLPAIRRFRKS
jgi:hypothetical protein